MVRGGTLEIWLVSSEVSDVTSRKFIYSMVDSLAEKDTPKMVMKILEMLPCTVLLIVGCMRVCGLSILE